MIPSKVWYRDGNSGINPDYLLVILCGLLDPSHHSIARLRYIALYQLSYTLAACAGTATGLEPATSPLAVDCCIAVGVFIICSAHYPGGPREPCRATQRNYWMP